MDPKHQTIADACGDDKPASVIAAEKFAAAVDKLDQRLERPDLTTATTATVGKLLAAAVDYDQASEHRRQHLETLRAIATERLETAWRTEIQGSLYERFRRAFDAAVAELQDAVTQAGSVPSEAALDNPHDRRWDRVRPALTEVLRLHEVRKAYPSADFVDYAEKQLTMVSILESSNVAIAWKNMHGHHLAGRTFWLTLVAGFPGITAIRWQDSGEQWAQPGPAKVREQERKLREQFAARARVPA